MGTIGPETSTEVDYTTVGGYDRRTRFVTQQKYRSEPRNFSKPLPYYTRKAFIDLPLDPKVPWSWVDCLNFGAATYDPYHSKDAYARTAQAAYGELESSIRSLSQGWGESLAQRKQAFDMMLHRLGTLILAAKRLKRGDIPGFARALGATPKRHKSKLMKLSDTWLEYHFGWEPLYKDIYAACKALTSFHMPYGIVNGRGVERVHLHDTGGYAHQHFTGKVVTKIQGTYYVDNPNKFLLNQSGVINPIAVAWELVPFSFVVDWFIPVGQFLGSLTTFYGVARANEFTTTASFIDSTTSIPIVGGEWRGYNSHAVTVKRSLGISVPRPTFKLFDRFSPVRGATAIALLVGMLRSLDK